MNKYNLYQIKKIPILEVADRLGIQVRRNKTNCFSHTDKNPSLSFKPANNTFKCFGCNIGGTNIDLVMAHQNLDKGEAIRWLAEQYGVISNQTNQIKRLPDYTKPEEIKDEKPCKLYQEFYQLCGPLDDSGNKFMRDKGFTPETIKKFGWKTITDKAITQIKQGKNRQELDDSGLFNGDKFKFYNHRYLIPYYEDNEIVWLRARTLDKDAETRLIVPAGRKTHFYNYDALYEVTGRLYICEGETDTITLAQDDKKALGITGVTQYQQLREIADIVATKFDKDIEVILAFDNDKPADMARIEARRIFEAKGILTYNLRIPPEFKDINDYYTDKRKVTDD